MFVKSFVLVLFAFFCLVGISAQTDRKAEAEKLFAEAESLFAKQTKDDFQNALPKYEQAAKICSEINEIKCQANSLNRMVEISYTTGNMKSALEYAKQVLPLFQKLGDKSMEAETLSNIAGFNDELGNSTEAIKYGEKSLEILRNIGDKKREAIALNGLGIFYSNIGEMEKAAEYLNQSLLLRREVKDRKGEARTLANLGTIFDDTGERKKSAEFYQEALKIFAEEKDLRSEAITLNNLGLVWRELGQFQKALDVYQKSLELRKQIGDKRGEAITLTNIAAIYHGLGETEQAVEISENALLIFQKGGFQRNEAVTLGSLAAMYGDKGDFTISIESRQKSLQIYKKIGDKGGQAFALRNIGLIYIEEDKDIASGLPYLMESLALAEEINDPERVALTKLALARYYEKINDTDKAEQHFSSALEINRKLGAAEDIVETLYQFARFENYRNRRHSALEKMSEVLSTLEDLRNNIKNEDFRLRFFSNQQKYYEFYLSLLITQHLLEPTKGFDALALTVSEKIRARSLLDSLGETRFNNDADVSPELIQKEKNLRQKIKFKESLRLEALRKNETEKITVIEKEIGELVTNHWSIRAEIRKQNAQFADLIQPEVISLEKIQKELLDNDTVLLEYALGKEQSYLFFVTHNSLEILLLPKRKEIEKTARLYLEGLKAYGQSDLRETPQQRHQRLKAVDKNWKENGKTLSKILLGNIQNKLPKKRLLIVQSGILQYVPFASLSNSNGSFLIETNEIVNLPSASVIPVLRENKKQKTHSNSIGILADPVFSKEDSRLRTASQKSIEKTTNLPRQLRSDFSRLRFSRREAEEIMRFSDSQESFAALDFGANLKTALSSQIQNARFVHFATHGIINSQFPELSSIVLSLIDENGNPQEGLLQLPDIYNMKLNADLVVLSACDSALGKEINGEGIIGLSRGFMYAGSPSVIASLWKVEDRATAELMKRFYRAMLKDKKRPAQALQTAQIEMLKEEQWQNPFYWAAFTIQGEWK